MIDQPAPRIGIMTLFDMSPELKSEPQLIDEWLELVRLADRLGVDAAWAAEHHFDNFGGACPSASVLMSAMAAQTKRIRIGSATITAPFHNAIRLAEEMNLIDVISGGRLECGVGRGWQPLEFNGFGIDMGTSTARTQEALHILRAGFRGERVTLKGTYNNLDDLRIIPRPVQREVPLWLASGRTASSLEWAGAEGLHMQAILYAAPDLQNVIDLCAVHRNAWQKAGHDPEKRRVGLAVHLFIAESDEAAQEQARPYFRNYVQHVRQGSKTQSWSGHKGYETYEQARTAGRNMTGDYATINEINKVFFGSPERVADQILWAAETFGMTDFLGISSFGGQPKELTERTVRLLAERVMPAVRSARKAA